VALSEPRRIQGPLTGYDYPLVNAFLEWLREWRERWRKRLAKQTTIETTSETRTKSKIYENLEEYSIYEDASGVIKVRVKRKAEREA